jgi:hypothetical protein
MLPMPPGLSKGPRAGQPVNAKNANDRNARMRFVILINHLLSVANQLESKHFTNPLDGRIG